MASSRIFILGAGFSRSAGLPLGDELWREIRDRCEGRTGRARKFSSDLDLYIRYRKECDGIKLNLADVEFEEFLAFLDVEYALRLSGSGTWSSFGNETQVMVKQLIGQILNKKTPLPGAIPSLYTDFAEQLQPGDYVLTFNYDILLERSLDQVKKPYRLFPERYSEVTSQFCSIDPSGWKEVAVFKPHGSVDWFDRSTYSDLEAHHKTIGAPNPPKDPVFFSENDIELQQLVEGPRPDNDPLGSVFRVVKGLDHIYRAPSFTSGIPHLLTPSKAKMLYAKQYLSFWSGLGQAGGSNSGLTIIGYSLPRHDDYAKQALFRLSQNYQNVEWGEPLFGDRTKGRIVYVDYKETEEGKQEALGTYGFLNPSKTTHIWSGFNVEAVKLIGAGISSS